MKPYSRHWNLSLTASSSQVFLPLLPQLPPLLVPSGATKVVPIKASLTVPPSQVMAIRELITTKDWTATLWLEVADGFDFPVYLLTKS